MRAEVRRTDVLLLVLQTFLSESVRCVARARLLRLCVERALWRDCVPTD